MTLYTISVIRRFNYVGSVVDEVYIVPLNDFRYNELIIMVKILTAGLQDAYFHDVEEYCDSILTYFNAERIKCKMSKMVVSNNPYAKRADIFMNIKKTNLREQIKYKLNK